VSPIIIQHFYKRELGSGVMIADLPLLRTKGAWKHRESTHLSSDGF